MFVGGFGYPGYRRFFLANVGRNRPEAERRRPKADATSGNRERKLQPETAQEKPLAPRVGFGRPALEIMAVFEEKWQKAKETIKERGIFMFNNDLLSDVSLVVRASSDECDAKKSKIAIPAHKFVLSICSPVFFAIFCGELAVKSDSVDLPDCDYEGVLEMLRYLYSGEVELNESNVMQVLYVAKKYILPSLADKCIEFLYRNLDPANALSVLSHALQYDEKSLVDRCWEVIDRETEEVVKSEGFGTIERSLLEAIVKRDSLTIREVELFKAVDLWATKDCERQSLAANGNVKRNVLGEVIVKSMRFPAMEEKEFASVVHNSKILTPEEEDELMKNFNGVRTEPLAFPVDNRIGSLQSCRRFRSYRVAIYDIIECYENTLEYDSIEFWVDRDVMLHGIRLLGSQDHEYTVSMKIKECCQRKEPLFLLEKEVFSCVPLPSKAGQIDGFDIFFDPFVLRKNKHYVVEASIDGPESCFGERGYGFCRMPWRGILLFKAF